MPDGTIIRNVPANATRQQIADAYERARASGKVADKRPTSFWQGVVNNVAKAGSNLIWLTDTLQGRNLARQITGQPSPSDITRAQADRMARQASHRGSTAGNITGGIVGSLPTLLIPGGPFVQGAASGALLTNDPNKTGALLEDAALGGVAGKVGGMFGKHVVAPVAERVGRTAPARALGKAVVNLADNIVPGSVRQLPLPKFTPTDRAVNRMAPDVAAARQVAADAARLKLPVAMADVDPRLQQLAGSVARHSPDARALAEKTLNARARGQSARAVEAIDRHLAPVTDIEERAASIMERGKPVYDPLYEKAYEGPVVTSPKIEQILTTPAGKQAVGKANTIAANEFRDPRALGFATDDVGNVVLNTPPTDAMDRFDLARQGWDAANSAYEAALRRQQASLAPNQLAGEVGKAGAALDRANVELDLAKQAFAQAPRSGTVRGAEGYTPQSLDYVKGGLDDMLEPYRNEITGRLDLDRNGRAINSMKNQLLSELDSLNPDYKAARAAYGEFAKQSEALTTGHKLLPQTNLPERNFNRILSRAQRYDANLPAEKADMALVPELQTGFATKMADIADKARLSANPYEAVYGSPSQQAKVAALFPDGAEDFGRIYDLEGIMGQTRTKALGGSQTQANKASDDLFQNEAANMAVDGALQAVTGGGVPGATKIAGIVGRKFIGSRDLGVLGAEKKANEIAPMLFDTSNPGAIADYLDELARKQLEQEVRRGAYQKAGGMFGRGLGLAPAIAVGGIGSH